MSSWMLKNSGGEPDGVWTLTVLSFIIVSACVTLSMFDQITLGKAVFNIKTPDVALLTLYLGMTGGGYVLRRKQKLDAEKEIVDEVEKKDV